MKTKSKKLTFSIEIRETPDLRWEVWLSSQRGTDCVDRAFISEFHRDNLYLARGKASDLSSVVHGAAIEELPYEAVRDRRIKTLESLLATAQHALARSDIGGPERRIWTPVVQDYPAELARLRAWVRPATEIAA